MCANVQRYPFSNVAMPCCPHRAIESDTTYKNFPSPKVGKGGGLIVTYGRCCEEGRDPEKGRFSNSALAGRLHHRIVNTIE